MLFGFVIRDDCDFFRGNAIGDEFPFQLDPGIEKNVLPVRKLVQVGKDGLRRSNLIILPVSFQNIPDTDIEFGIRVVGEVVVDQTRIKRDFSGQAIDQKRNVEPFRFIFPSQVFEPLVQGGQILHEFGDHFSARDRDLSGSAAFDIRQHDIFEILLTNHVRHIPEKYRQLRDIHVHAESCDHAQAAGGIDFECGFLCREDGGELVEGLHVELLQCFGGDVPDHDPELRQGICDWSCRGKIDIPASGFLADMIKFERQSERPFAERPVQTFYRRHFAGEKIFFVGMGFIDKNRINAQLAEIDDIFHRFPVLKLFEAKFQMPFLSFRIFD